MMGRAHLEAEEEAHPGSQVWTLEVVSSAKFKESRSLPGPGGGGSVIIPILKGRPQSLGSFLVPRSPHSPFCRHRLSLPGGDRGGIQLLPGLPDGASVSEPSQGLPRPRDGPRCTPLHIPAVLLLCWLAEGEPPRDEASCGPGSHGRLGEEVPYTVALETVRRASLRGVERWTRQEPRFKGGSKAARGST